VKKIFLGVLIVTVFIVGGFFFFWYGENKATGNLTENLLFVVEKGEPASSVASRLEEAGAIQSKYIFLAHLAKEGQRNKLQQGVYTVSPTDTVVMIASRMVNGEITRTDIRVTFPEGWPAKLMAERLTKNGLPGDEFYEQAMNPGPQWRTKYAFLNSAPAGASLEGFLFPDTYDFKPDVTAEDIIDRMLGNFQKKLTPDIEAAAQARQKSLFELMTLASIVEEEGRKEEDRKIIADVFWKRLAKGQPFESDATVNYVLGTFKEQPTFEDTEADSPYNTYRHAGLPPGPISNPSIQSIRATAFPTPNPYYYFLNNLETKEMYFGETYEDHLQNRRDHGL
jgi:UPF0755 protein